ncbi:DUF4178 domain-containing protein [Heliomicrobium gestii]|nr:DUF4178 domain-containing protein [Heliomicrobium gestii]MBM7866173.1 hypothetical protein [Heliomicrobium gestii]
MSLFDRMRRIFDSETHAGEPVVRERTLFDLDVNDIVSLDLEDWVIEGRVIYHSLPGWVMYWLKSGRQRQGLLLDRSVPDKAVVITPFPGRTDNMNEVKTEYILDGKHYFLDYNGEGIVDASAVTPIRTGQVMYWQFETDEREIYRIEWQEGRFFHYDGRWIDAFEVSIVAG